MDIVSHLEDTENELLQSLTDESVTIYKAKEKRRKTFHKLMDNVPTMSDEDFWFCIEMLRSSRTKYEKGGVYRFLDCFVHDLIIGDRHSINRNPNKKEFSLIDAVRFIKTYNIKVRDLYKPLFDVIEGYGDDGYGDILDSFPMFGRATYVEAIKGKIADDLDPDQGENYIAMHLETLIIKSVGHQLRYQAMDNEEA